ARVVVGIAAGNICGQAVDPLHPPLLDPPRRRLHVSGLRSNRPLEAQEHVEGIRRKVATRLCRRRWNRELSMLKNRLILVLILLAVIFPFISNLVDFYTDWLFFVETGFSSVFTTTLYAKTGSGLFFGGLLFILMQANLYYANRAKLPLSGILFVGGGNFRVNRNDANRLVKPASTIICLILALFAGNWGAMQWNDLLLFAHKSAVGTVDPVLGKDLGFYLFTLPFMEILQSFASFIVLATAMLSGAAYFVRGGIILTDRGATIDEKVRRHLAVLVGIFACVVAAGFYLDSFSLLLSGSGTFPGAGYVDVHSRLLTYRVLTFLTPLAGAMLAVGIWKGVWRCCRRSSWWHSIWSASVSIRGCCRNSRSPPTSWPWRHPTSRTISGSPGSATIWNRSKPFPSMSMRSSPLWISPTMPPLSRTSGSGIMPRCSRRTASCSRSGRTTSFSMWITTATW